MANLVNDPILNEFVYTVLYHSTLEEKRGLRGKYLKISRNSKAAKTFATTSSREEKDYILAHFGIESFTVFAKRGTGLLKFKEILEKFEKNKKVAALSAIAEERIFVTSDKEFLRLLTFMSSAIHHHTHSLNLELIRQGYHIQKWAKQYKNEKDMQTKEADACAKLLARTCLSANFMMEAWPGNTGYTALEMKILLYLYTVPHLSVPKGVLFGKFMGYTNGHKFSGALRALEAEQLVLRHCIDGDNEFMITGLGVKQIGEYVNRVINLNDF